MTAPASRCVVILSTKSAGSSVLQRSIAAHPGVHTVERTRHRQHETLYWVKAASVLGRVQVPQVDSEVPIPARRARRDLVELLRANLGPAYAPPTDDRTLIFDGWRALCERFAPVFLEKSPHHLPQPAAIELMLEAFARTPTVDFLMVGLVRNPMDTVYSRWQRWRTPPERSAEEWLQAYGNLRDLYPRLGDRLVTVRYEDLVRGDAPLAPVRAFLGSHPGPSEARHDNSVGKWRRDRLFGYRLPARVQALGEAYGYAPETMTNTTRRLWPLYRHGARWMFRGLRAVGPVRAVLRRVKQGLTSRRSA